MPPELAHFWAAFADLSGSRPVGMAPGAIPLTEVEAWFRLHGVDDPEDREEYLEVIRILDAAYLGSDRERRNATSTTAPTVKGK